ncbi:MAG: 2OG-Fe(II) oxygenase [Legionella sp.]|uniref:2OG-Fe(II) oxygenase n=1 Tax=Legionella sp. TaxID=459 RepID=UPI0039E5E33D
MNFELLIQNICHQGFHIIDNWLALESCQALQILAQELYEQDLFRSAKIGLKVDSHQNKTIRTDKILWIEGNEHHLAIQLFLAAIQKLAHALNQTLFLGLNEFETHFANYQPGTFYKKHIDQFTAQKTRRISFVYYLNKNWQPQYGGMLNLYNSEDQLIQQVLPQENRFICFNSDLPHEVLITHHPRYSITGWMKTRTLSLF